MAIPVFPLPVLTKNNWVFGTASDATKAKTLAFDGEQTATLTVNYVTTTGDASQVGRVIVGQIHATDNEPLRLYYRKLPSNTKGAIYFAHEPSPAAKLTGYPVTWHEMIGSRSSTATDPEDGVALGEKFSYKIQAVGNALTITIMRAGKADVVKTIDMSTSGYAADDQYMYFKAGVYNQNNTGDASDYVQATFYAISNSHTTYVPSSSSSSSSTSTSSSGSSVAALMAEWRFEEALAGATSGTNAVDVIASFALPMGSSGNRAVFSQTTNNAGINNKAVLLTQASATSNYWKIACASVPVSIYPTDALSLEITAKFTAPGAQIGDVTLVRRLTNSKGYKLYVKADNTLVFAINGTTLTTAHTVTSGWHHYTATYDKQFMRLYVDGVEVGNEVLTEAITSMTGETSGCDFKVAGESTSKADNNLSGAVDDVLVYSYALSPAQVWSRAGNYSAAASSSSVASSSAASSVVSSSIVSSSVVSSSAVSSSVASSQNSSSTGSTLFKIVASQNTAVLRNDFDFTGPTAALGQSGLVTTTDSNDIEVAFNNFHDHLFPGNNGQTLVKGSFIKAQVDTVNTVKVISKRTWIHHNQFKNMAPHISAGKTEPDGDSDREAIVFGASESNQLETSHLVEYNLFDNCDGENEIITVKTSVNVIRYNTFKNFMGSLSIRFGYDTEAYGNYFFGEGASASYTDPNYQTGGIRIYGLNHKVYNNHMQGLSGTTWRLPILLDSGDTTSGTSSGHQKPVGVVIANNTGVDNMGGLSIGGSVYTQQPSGNTIINNVVVGSEGVLIDNKAGASNTVSTNLAFASGTATAGEAYLFVDPVLESQTLNGYSIKKLSSGSAAVNSAQDVPSYISTDIDGEERVLADIGADEYSAAAALTHKPLQAVDVDPAAASK